MSVFFRRRGAASGRGASVTITGSGNASRCYATIDGTKYSDAASGITVKAGDIITFGVYGSAASAYGEVRIDGTRVLQVTSKKTQTYDWTVPEGKNSISINLNYESQTQRENGKITVTTE